MSNRSTAVEGGNTSRFIKGSRSIVGGKNALKTNFERAAINLASATDNLTRHPSVDFAQKSTISALEKVAAARKALTDNGEVIPTSLEADIQKVEQEARRLLGEADSGLTSINIH